MIITEKGIQYNDWFFVLSPGDKAWVLDHMRKDPLDYMLGNLHSVAKEEYRMEDLDEAERKELGL